MLLASMDYSAIHLTVKLQSGENLEIVKTIVTLVGNLGMQVIAEGVETPDQLEQLRLLKCHYAQGYLFSKPLAVTDADMFIVSARATTE
jgi:EAL domain-containing protein (putative c-di-GMP-specific phosphodiesterase class I)